MNFGNSYNYEEENPRKRSRSRSSSPESKFRKENPKEEEEEGAIYSKSPESSPRNSNPEGSPKTFPNNRGGGYRNQSWNRGHYRGLNQRNQRNNFNYYQRYNDREDKLKISERKLNREWDELRGERDAFRRERLDIEGKIRKEKSELKRIYEISKDQFSNLQKLLQDSVLSRREY